MALGIKRFDWSSHFKKDFNNLAADLQDATGEALKDLLKDIVPPGRNLKTRNPKKKKVRQVNVRGQYRMTFNVEDGVCYLRRVGVHRSIEKAD